MAFALEKRQVHPKAVDFADRTAELAGQFPRGYYFLADQLNRDGRYDEAIELLTKLVDATESESQAAGPGLGVGPWYYEQLAIIYRKQKRLDDEVAILQRYAGQPKAPGVGPSKLAERLEKAKQLAAKAK